MLRLASRAASAASAPARAPAHRLSATRALNVHEHHAMRLLGDAGVRVPVNQVAESPAEARAAAERLVKEHGSKDLVVKAQVLTGGRGRGKFKSGFKGGVHVVTSPAEAEEFARKMIGQRLITKQTGAEGLPCNKVMVTERLYLRRETYFSILMDRASNGPVLVGSPRGGTSIEEVAAETPDQIFKEVVDIATGPTPEQIARLAANMGFQGQAAVEAERMIDNMYKFFIQHDATLVEINPLAETPDGKVYAVDSKLNFDDNAEFRQASVFALRDRSQEDPLEVEAALHDLTLITLDGDVASLINGAGLAMATNDLVTLHGGKCANFLDIGGGATKERVIKALGILNSNPKVNAIFINVFGGIVKCSVIAAGIVAAAKTVGLNKPLVVRLQGTNVEEARQIIESSGYRMLMVDDFDEAAVKVVRIAEIVERAKALQIGVSFELPIM